MKFIEWNEEQLGKIKVIDEQHLSLADMLNQMHGLLGSDKNELVKNLLSKFCDDTKTHFDTEENLIKEYKFPNYFSHKMEHDRVLAQINKEKEVIISGGKMLTLEFLNSLRTWMFNHHELNDSKLCKFLAGQGVE
ncbi:MAG: hemerythrin family protein [Melioribacteraceae bacterium]|nr:hemerythrin family protein [Melioribacteraceae bacterium]